MISRWRRPFNCCTLPKECVNTIDDVLTCLSSVPCVTSWTRTMTSPIDISELEPAELEVAIGQLGVQQFHARQIYQWIYRRGVSDFGRMTDLSLSLRQQLEQSFVVSTPTIEKRQRSADDTEKLLLRLNDGQLVESVFIPDTPRQAFCVSTQVGCAMRCGFCLTGKMSLARNLTAGEIVGQVRRLAHTLELAETSFNVVLMGMGEPLHNYDATMKALRILSAESGFAMPSRRITLSTVGVPAGLTRLAHEAVIPNIAVSLHAATEDLREQLVPVNRTYALMDIIAACRKFPVARRRRITFEYVMLDRVNDSVRDAHRLATLLRGIRSKINLIPLNEAPGIPFRRPSDARIDQFARTLTNQGATVSVRKSRGRDIRAACGQLIVEGSAASPALAARMNR